MWQFPFVFIVITAIVVTLWYWGLTLASHWLYRLSHTSNPFFSGYFGDGVFHFA
jgi:hypothetical protein